MYCCDKMQELRIHSEIVEVGEPKHLEIYGHPDFADDGDVWDDMTETYEIKFCPFCGADVAPSTDRKGY